MNAPSDHSRIRFGDSVLMGGNTAYDWEPLGADYFTILRDFLIDSYEHYPFYRERFSRYGIDPSALKSFGDLAQIPLLTIDDVSIKHSPETTLLSNQHRSLLATGFSSLPASMRIAKRFFTTGSSGMGQKVSYFTFDDWDMLIADSSRQIQHIPVSSMSRALHLFRVPQSAFFSDTCARRGSIVEFANVANRTEADVLHQINHSFTDMGGLNCLLVPPCLPPGVSIKKGFTLDALLEADKSASIVRKIKTFFTAGAPRDLPEHPLKQSIWQANERHHTRRAKFIDIYGCTEIGTAAAECEYNDGHHLCQGRVYTEVIDKHTGLPVGNGERGLIVQTCMRQGSRYIRYVVGDEATYITDPCRCGRQSPRLKDITRSRHVGQLLGL